MIRIDLCRITNAGIYVFKKEELNNIKHMFQLSHVCTYLSWWRLKYKLNAGSVQLKNCIRGYFPRANGAKRRSGRKPGARVTNLALPLAKFKVVVHGRWGWDFLWYVMTSCSLILTIWRTIVSNGFHWLTRLFCSFPYHDNGYLNLAFCTEYDWMNSTHRQEREQECKHNSQK